MFVVKLFENCSKMFLRHNKLRKTIHINYLTVGLSIIDNSQNILVHNYTIKAIIIKSTLNI